MKARTADRGGRERNIGHQIRNHGAFVTTLQIFTFFLKRPHYYPELARRVRKRIGGALLPKPMGRSAEVARNWAAERAVSQDEALKRLGCPDMRGLSEMFPAEMAGAAERMEKCPVKMGGSGGVDVLYHIARHLGARQIVETGVAYGFSSLALLLALRETGGRLVSVDMPYPGRGNDSFVGCAVPEELRSQWTLLRYPDSIGLGKALAQFQGTLDFCHYDSDKSYEGRAWAYPLIWKALRPGGILMSDDIDDNTGFRDFAYEIGVEPLIVNAAGVGGAGHRHVGILIRPAR